ncbi:hypothetical protein OEZ86_005927 [Tetradesmus obliquus]|nr:hypothetical protein OEZ86_005927 [Tetradesmus obliquus]
MVEQKHALVAAALTATTVAAACHLLSRHYNLQTALLQGPRSSNNKSLQQLSRGFGASSIAAQAAAGSKPDVQQAVCWDYAQSLEELLVEVQVPGTTLQQDVTVHISQQHLLVAVQQVAVLDAPLAGLVLPQCSSWQLEGKGSSRVLSITLCKVPPLSSEQRFAMWPSLLLAQDDSRLQQDQLRS